MLYSYTYIKRRKEFSKKGIQLRPSEEMIATYSPQGTWIGGILGVVVSFLFKQANYFYIYLAVGMFLGLVIGALIRRKNYKGPSQNL